MDNPKTNWKRFISLRWKLLVGFTLIFSIVFSLSYYWFYLFATDKTLKRLRQDLRDTAQGALQGVNVQESLRLYQIGQPNFTGYSDSTLYTNQLAWFKKVHSIEPRVYPYTMIVGKPEDNRKIGTTKAKDLEIVYLVDSLWLYQPDRALKFLEPNADLSPQHRQAFLKGVTTETDLYTDKWGSWISVYTPLKDNAGKTIGLLGADIEADYVYEVQNAIRSNVFIAFTITYGSLFILVYFVSGIFTKPIVSLTKVAGEIGEGNYEQNLSQFAQVKILDEISTLAQVFELMVGKVRTREEKLKQQVTELKIEIDHAKRQKQVSEIVDSDFFQDLQAKARQIRRRKTEGNGNSPK